MSITPEFLAKLEHEIQTALQPSLQRQPPNAATPTAPEIQKRTELDFANRLAASLPPIKTCDHDWFAYGNGVWKPVSRAEFRPAAQNALTPAMRTARRETALLDHLEGRFQVPDTVFRGFACFDDSGAILMNTANGVVRIAPSGAISVLPHSPDYLFTRQTAAGYHPDAPADLFRRVLGEALPDPEDQGLLQLCCGNFLLPDCRYEIALVCYGGGGCGKSTLADPIAAALGPGLVQRLSLSQICDPKSYNLPKLRYAAVNLGTELDSLAVDESANFKTLVSGEPVEARPIYGEPFVMQTACKLWFLANGLPRFKNGSDAELRRTRFIRFNRKPAQADTRLKERLILERDGVLRFMIEGLQRLLALPEMPLGGIESRETGDCFQTNNDPIGRFAQLHCVFDPAQRVSKEAVAEAYKAFCEQNHLPEEYEAWFFRRFHERFTQIKETRIKDGQERKRYFVGMSLQNTTDYI